jgi:flavin reductase (DIM6/NTAB) family NADH-FMN oxidoreductase RutF
MTTPPPHYYEPATGHGLAHDPFKAIIGPRPIGWISTRALDGTLNLAPYSYFNAFNDTPPIIGFASTGWKHTVANIEATGEFVFNLATRALAEQMNQSSAPVGPEVDEFALAGLTPAPCHQVTVPRVAESPVAMECRLLSITQLRSLSGAPVAGWLTLGEVVGVHIAPACLRDGTYMTALAQPVLRAGGAEYLEVTQDRLFRLRRPK